MRLILLNAVLMLLPLGFAQAQEWEQVGEMPVPRADMATVVLGDTLYLLGGSVPGTSSPIASANVAKFAMAEQVMLPNAPAMNFPRIGSEAVVYDSTILVFGGRRDEENYVSEIEAWRPGQTEWVVVGNLTPARSGMRAVVLEDHIMVTGGTSGPLLRHNRIDLVIPYLDAVPPYVATSVSNDTLPSPRSHHGLARLGDSLFLFGGYSLWPLNDSYLWDEEGWTPTNSMIYGVGGMAVALFTIQQTQLLVVAGGRALSGELTSIQYVNSAGNWWVGNSYVQPLPSARTGHALASLTSNENRTIYVLGGSYENSSGQKVLLNDILSFSWDNTPVAEENRDLKPGDFTLDAHPNPSNGAVTITIVPMTGINTLDVRIFDLLGREVHHWDLPTSPHRTTLSWDGTQGGRDIAGGIYFLVARSGEQQRVLKLFRMP